MMLKNILLTTENYYPVGGGIEQFVRGFAEFLTSEGCQVWIYTKDYPEKGISGEVKKPEGTVIYSPLMEGSLKEPFEVMKKHSSAFAEFLKEKEIDLVLASNHNSLAWIRAGKQAGVPVVYACHGVGLMDPFKRRFLMPGDEISWGFPSILSAVRWIWKEEKPLWKRLLNYFIFFTPFLDKAPLQKPDLTKNYWRYLKAMKILNSAEGRYGNSKMTAELFRNQKNTFGYALPVNTQNSGFSNHYFPEEDLGFLKTFGIEKNKYILCPGRINNIKGQEYAIRALECVQDKNLKLVLAGNSSLFDGEKFQFGAYGEKLRKIIKKKGVKDRVVFTGFLDFEQMRKIYSGALVTVVPSVWLETFGYVTLESMACGSPVIVTENTGSRECLDENTSFVVPRKSAKAIAKVINENESRFAGMGKQAREKAVDGYDWSVRGHKLLGDLEKIYREYHERT